MSTGAVEEAHHDFYDAILVVVMRGCIYLNNSGAYGDLPLFSFLLAERDCDHTNTSSQLIKWETDQLKGSSKSKRMNIITTISETLIREGLKKINLKHMYLSISWI